jgi:hypothetical protein
LRHACTLEAFPFSAPHDRHRRILKDRTNNDLDPGEGIEVVLCYRRRRIARAPLLGDEVRRGNDPMHDSVSCLRNNR